MTTTDPGAPIVTTAPVSPLESADTWEDWLEVVSAEVDDDATADERLLVRQQPNLIRWLRALSVLDSDINAEIADARLAIQAARPTPNPGPDGDPAMRAWHDLRREHAVMHADRVRFRQAINERLIECRDRLAAAGLHERLTPESLLQHVARAHALLDDGDPDAAKGLLDSVLRQAEEVL